MKKRYFVFDSDACFGCFGCIAACINENQTSGKYHWRKVFKLPPHNEKSDTKYISLACNHCEEPPCVKVCPNEAMVKRNKDGIVIHEYNRCMGCRYCQMACPYGAIVWMEDKKIVGKCKLCIDRLEKNEEPACVETCFAGALSVITEEELLKEHNLHKDLIGFFHDNKIKPKIRFRKSNKKNGK